MHDLVVVDDDSKLPALVEFRFAQALTSDKRLLAIADDRACVKTHPHVLMGGHRSRRFTDPPYDANLGPSANPFSQKSNHPRVADFGIVNQQLLLRSLDKTRQQLARIYRAYDEITEFRTVGLPFDIGFEQLRRLPYEIRVIRD